MKGSKLTRKKDAVKKDNASEQNKDPFHFEGSTDDDVCNLLSIFHRDTCNFSK